MKDAPPAQPPTIVITAQPDPRRLTSPPQLLGAPPTPPWGAAPSPESAAAPLGESVPKPQLADAADNPPSRQRGSGVGVVAGLIFLSVITTGLISLEPWPSIAMIRLIVWAMSWMKRFFLGTRRVVLMVTSGLCLALKALTLLVWAMTT